MREQTKKMLTLLLNHGSINDRQAKGITNPRREAGLIDSRTEHEVDIRKQSETKRKYTLQEV